MGKIVHENIIKGKTYVYFYPDDLLRRESEIARLKENILLANPAHAKTLLSKITLVALNRTEHAKLFYRGNIILYFRDKNRAFPPRWLHLQKFRGEDFWQEHSESIANEIKHELEVELSRGKKRRIVEVIVSNVKRLDRMCYLNKYHPFWRDR